LCVPGLIYGGLPFFIETWRLLKQKKVGVPTLIAITIGGCIVYGFFFIISLSIFLYLLAQKIVSKVKEDSKGKLIDVFRQLPDFAWVLIDNVEIRIPLNQVKEDDIVVVRAGEIIPADGIITDGMASIDQHIFTGEFVAVEKETGSEVFASTLVLSGRICIKIKKAGKDTAVCKIGEILNNTVDFKSTMMFRVEDIAEKTALPTFICAAIALPFIGPASALAISDAHFKNKMNFAAPISILNYFRIASNHGILIKDGRSLDFLPKVDTIVFDKTGTLTAEEPLIGKIYRCSDYNEDEIITYVAVAEIRQTHPIAIGIKNEAKRRKLNIPEPLESEYKVGYGLTVKTGNSLIQVGSVRFMELINIPITPAMEKNMAFCETQGFSLVMVAKNKQMIGAIEMRPSLRPEAKKIVSQLKKRQSIRHFYIISGDNEIPTQKLAQELGIENYFANTMPEQKADIIDRLKNEGKFICYVGDGINDSIAMKKSHVPISLKGASTVAMDTAHIILMNNDLKNLDMLFEIADKFKKNINTSLAILMTGTIIGTTGALFFGFVIANTILINLISLLSVCINSMIPYWGDNDDNKPKQLE